MPQSVAFMVMLLAAVFPLSSFAGENIIKLDTRGGIKIDLLISMPEVMNEAAVIMFPGGDGSNQFAVEEGRIKRGDNFLVRTAPLFVNKGFVVAVVGMPSDKPAGMDDDFRSSAEHLQDIAKVIDFIARQECSSIYLAGTSRGTISIAYLSTALKHRSIAGLSLLRQ